MPNTTYLDQQSLTFKRKVHEYGDVYTFIFTPENPVVFEPGMYAHVRVADVAEGKPVREISIASLPKESEVWFTVHVRERSAFKKQLATLEQGDHIEIFKIKGWISLPETSDQEVVFIAGGIGITPFRSMLHEAIERNMSATLIHVARDEYLFEKELSKLPADQHRIRRDELATDLQNITKAKPDAIYYIAGTPGFVSSIEEKLKSLGINEDHIQQDSFDGY
jgi:ferredoxin-NADP reductase